MAYHESFFQLHTHTDMKHTTTCKKMGGYSTKGEKKELSGELKAVADWLFKDRFVSPTPKFWVGIYVLIA